MPYCKFGHPSVSYGYDDCFAIEKAFNKGLTT